ncbi:MAG TPA: NADH-ubiquinone oxidoreductase-F iron-sulfur binding region domain-containing protein [Bacteroidales bacterium]|nr:NADH-ubiquinone oxidoreductase-F iron-sulfur binding region domain-containing protein [Bacteroidales bacterium]HPB24435.1 NADH-ubiquinone oxidoreductase-F iron-sulfur binding region domain-containing protein [Bacteroidales bacterium]HPI29343.1 NADH-ubiquinone oxidoreductase-F iron-sulfur binding region domain-containing protein [Bacteroidales bacterium]HQN14961.1 NADH-ubiquinone oxidoreductase-F iron-sulfur binding region domain-containing protein [Bacteroidales bacterium]HQP16075.1 NADH-ubi
MDTLNQKRIDLIFSNYTTSRYQVLERSLQRPPEDIINELMDAGLKGRGNVGFPTGMKWKFAKREESAEKYVICNANESETGTFKDREILERVPRKVLSGMAICGYCTGAKKGIIYLRYEYAYLKEQLQNELNIFHEHIKKFNLDFAIEIFLGGGSYVSGEESALIESMEGKRAEPRNKPPYPVISGLYGLPTVVNNVETFATAQVICAIGAEEFLKLGTVYSPGSKLFSISGDTIKPGIHELELGTTIEEVVNEFGDKNTKSVQVGGASGFCIPHRLFAETVIGYEGLTTGGSMIFFNNTRSMYKVLHEYLRFFAEESCGLCTPCRIGTQQLLLGIEAIKRGDRPAGYMDVLKKLALNMKTSAKCGLGQSVANPFISILENFKEEILY